MSREVGKGGGEEGCRTGEERCRTGQEGSEDRADGSNGHFPRTNDECDEDTKDPESLPIGYQVSNTPLSCAWPGGAIHMV